MAFIDKYERKSALLSPISSRHFEVSWYGVERLDPPLNPGVVLANLIEVFWGLMIPKTSGGNQIYIYVLGHA